MATKAPIDKLPLAVRKDVRDEFESKREETEGAISTLLGEKWTIEANPNLIFAYAEEGSYGHGSLGACMRAYFDGAIYRLKYFLESAGHGPEGAAEINKLAHKHIMSLEPDHTKKYTYSGVDIRDGVFRIIFSEKELGVNIDGALVEVEKAINEASKAAKHEPLSYTARNGIKQDYEAKVEEVKAGLVKQAHNDKLVLEPNWEANSAKLASGGKDVREDWEQHLGDFTRKYFEGLEYQMRYRKFEEDDLLYEGFNEAIDKSKVELRVVDKLQKGSYNEVLIEDGILVIQTTPANFGTNVDYAAEKIVDIL